MNVHEFTLPRLDGTPQNLGDYAGQVLLVVNVASKCGLTPQYRGLVELRNQHHARGFEVLGFPCNQFGGQEPGNAEEIETFCATTYGVDFPLFAKLEVNGAGRHPLYGYLTEQQTAPDGPGDIRWNFAKFLVNREGRVVARFSPATTPDDPALCTAVEDALAET